MDQDDSTVSKGGINIAVDVSMPDDSPLQELRSPSHPIAVALGRTSTSESQPPHLSRASASLSLGSSALDKDFVLEIGCQVCHSKVTPSLFNKRLQCVSRDKTREQAKGKMIIFSKRL